MIKEQIVKYPDRAEADRFYNYPYAAIEEALANAGYHKAYDIREPIEVRIEKDKIEILSFPGPDHSVTIEGLRTYRVTNRRYRNRRIGEFLKELHLTEGRNTGFRKILNALERNGSPKPEFETDEAHSYFITRIFVREGFEKEIYDLTSSFENGIENGIDILLVDVEEKFEGCTMKKLRNIEQILRAIYQNRKISIAELKDTTGLSERTVTRYLKELKEEGVIVREGPDHGGMWKIL